MPRILFRLGRVIMTLFICIVTNRLGARITVSHAFLSNKRCSIKSSAKFPNGSRFGRLNILSLGISGSPDGTITFRNGLKQPSPPTNSSGISESLVNALDLNPIFEIISDYCVTGWGKESIISIIQNRRMKLHHDMFQVATSLNEARQEYALVEEAMSFLKQKQIPPIRKWKQSVTHDDNQWMESTFFGRNNDFQLEYIARTDYIVSQVISNIEWLEQMNHQESNRNQLLHFSQSVISDLRPFVHSLSHKIENAVIRSESTRLLPIFSDESNTFVLNSKKFPDLAALRNREAALKGEIVFSMNRIIATEDMRSKLSKDPDGSIPRDFIEFEGRCLLPVKPSFAASVGIIRGYSRSKKTCYVEPSQVSENNYKLTMLKNEIEELEKSIIKNLISRIINESPTLWRAIYLLGRLDTIFARAAFGVSMGAVIPRMFDEGTIDIIDFLHPLLTNQLPSMTSSNVTAKTSVPISLKLNTRECKSIVIISGPNGGGKTAALKSFGVAALLSKLGVPIIASSTSRVDYFQNIFGEIGDSQSIINGKSTLIARMQSLSSMTNKIAQKYTPGTDSNKTYDLVLLDELASGTDPVAGYALARSILEFIILKNSQTCIVGTTHSPQLKSFALENEKMTSASVLLDNSDKNHGIYRRPTFKLAYNSVGESHALAAASRCSFPVEILDRASALLGSEDENVTYVGALVDILEKEKEIIDLMKIQAKELVNDSRKILATTSQVALMYEKKYSRVEYRLNEIFRKLVEAENADSFQLTGKLLEEVRLQRIKIKSEQELLQERGVRKIPSNYNLKDGEIVVIISGPFDGEIARVVQSRGESVIVSPLLGSGFDLISLETELINSEMVLNRNDLAIWDNAEEDENKLTASTIKRDAYERLENALTKISSNQTPRKSAKSCSNTESFRSSRERKAEKKKARKKK